MPKAPGNPTVPETGNFAGEPIHSTNIRGRLGSADRAKG